MKVTSQKSVLLGAVFLRKEKTGMEDLIDETELVDMPDSLLVLGSLDLDSSKIQPFYPQEEKINDLVEEIAALKAQVRDYDSRIRNWDSSVDIFRKIHKVEETISKRFSRDTAKITFLCM